MPHGTRACYQAGCRRLECRSANAAYRRAHAHYVDAGPAAAHCARLRAEGMGVPRIAALAGVAEATVWALVTGTRTTLQQATSAAVLGVPCRPALGSMVSGRSVHRLIQRAILEGFSRRHLAAVCGVSRLPRAGMRLRTALKIRRFYRLYVQGRDEAGTVGPHEEGHHE